LPQSGSEAAFSQLAALARATEVDVLFDETWLYGGDTLATFKRLIEHPEGFISYPVGRYYSRLVRRENWPEEAGVDADAYGGDLPPPYAEASNTEASKKRPRQGE
jgi:hypothetical protein